MKQGVFLARPVEGRGTGIAPGRRMTRRVLALFLVAALAAFAVAVAAVERTVSVAPPARAIAGPPSPNEGSRDVSPSTGIAARSRELIGYYHSISLSPGEEAIKAEVLGSMPAPCCRGSSALTCCCPCNLSKTLWGLSNHARHEQHANAEELRGIVNDWLEETNPQGTGRGSGCYRGACEAAFDQGGCGGMKESALSL